MRSCPPIVMRTVLLLAPIAVGLGIGIGSSSPARAASFSISLDGDTPLAATRTEAITGPHTIDIFLDLLDPEVASVFEGTFSVDILGGNGSTASLLAPSSSDWNFGCFAGTTTVSCTSDNAGGQRLVGHFDVDVASGDSLDIAWVTGFAAKDIDDPPFVMDVPITTPEGTVLFSTPEPETTTLLLLGLSGLAVASRPRKPVA